LCCKSERVETVKTDSWAIAARQLCLTSALAEESGRESNAIIGKTIDPENILL
jgi:hypothetical protein